MHAIRWKRPARRPDSGARCCRGLAAPSIRFRLGGRAYGGLVLGGLLLGLILLLLVLRAIRDGGAPARWVSQGLRLLVATALLGNLCIAGMATALTLSTYRAAPARRYPGPTSWEGSNDQKRFSAI